MKAEIIEGQLILFPESFTEDYALRMLVKESPNQILMAKDVLIDHTEFTSSMYD